MTDKNMAAFPRTEYDGSAYEGMTLRDYFAAKALAGDFVSQNSESGFFTNDISDEWMKDRSKLFYRMADAMIAAR